MRGSESSYFGETVHRNSGKPFAQWHKGRHNPNYLPARTFFVLALKHSGWRVLRPPLHATVEVTFVVTRPNSQGPLFLWPRAINAKEDITRATALNIKEYSLHGSTEGGLAVVDRFRSKEAPVHPNQLHIAEDRHSSPFISAIAPSFVRRYRCHLADRRSVSRRDRQRRSESGKSSRALAGLQNTRYVPENPV